MSEATRASEQHLYKAPPCGSLSRRDGSCVVLLMRHLGDAVISCGFIRSLQVSNPEMSVDILGRPGLHEILSSLCSFQNYIGVDVPLFGHHRRTYSSISNAIRVLRTVRKQKYDLCINLIGDVRENAIGVVTGARWNVAPVWSRGHIFRQKMTAGYAKKFTNCGIEIPSEFENYYESLRFLARQLGMVDLDWRLPGSRLKADQRNRQPRVSLHPGASHPSRHWPNEKWKDLIRRLHDLGCHLVLLGAPNEEPMLRNEFRVEIAEFDVEIVADRISGFLSALSRTNLLIGMDSLSAHAAYSACVPSIVLNGSSDPRIMTPPGSFPISAGALCRDFPCNYKYSCQGKEGEYICCRGIEVEAVFEAAKQLLTQAIAECPPASSPTV